MWWETLIILCAARVGHVIEKLYTGEHILLLCSRLRVLRVFFCPPKVNKSPAKVVVGALAAPGAILKLFLCFYIFLVQTLFCQVWVKLEMNEKLKVLEVDDCSGMWIMRQWPVWLTDAQIQGLQVCRWPLQCFNFNSSSIPIELKLTRKSTVAYSSWDWDEEILVLTVFELHTSVALEIFVLCMSAPGKKNVHGTLHIWPHHLTGHRPWPVTWEAVLKNGFSTLMSSNSVGNQVRVKVPTVTSHQTQRHRDIVQKRDERRFKLK